jgi:tetratricopeptide (TPR) repeat protein
MHGDLGYAYALNGRGADSDREYAAALQIYTSLGRQGSPGAIAILNNWSTAAINAGDVPRALGLFDEVIRLAASNSAGSAPPPYALGNRAAALLALGRYDAAIAQAIEARHVSQRANNKVFETSALLSLAGAHMERGEFDQAERFLQEAADTARDIPADSAIAIVANLRRARLALLRGDHQAAATRIAPVIALFEARGMRISTLCIALRVRAESTGRLGDLPAAIRDAEAALAIARALQGERPYSLQTGLSWLLLAQLRRETGDASGARAAGQTAADHLVPMLGAEHRDSQLARTIASN